jgi:anti-anti-sigma factor
MKLKLLSAEKNLVHVECSDTITLIDVQERDPLDALLGVGCAIRPIMLDMSQVSYIDTAAVSWFIRCHKACKETGGCFVIHSVPPMVLQVLQLLRMDQILNIAEDERKARTIVEGAKP